MKYFITLFIVAIMNKFIKGRIRSVKYALKGFYLLITTEHAIIAQLCIGACFVVLGYCLGISKTEWMLQTIALGMVLSIESLNTAVEKVCDFIHPEFHDRIGFIKDISAGAFTFAAFTAFTVAAIIYFPYVMAYLSR